MFSVVWTIATLLIDITVDQICRLQKIQIAAKVVFFLFFVFAKSRHEHVKPLLEKLHWLPFKERILFKIATFAFRFFDGTLPPYLSPCLSVYTPPRTLRSTSDEKSLSCARWKLKGCGLRSFSVQAPLVWNNLLPHIRHSKAFLFTSAFSELP